MRIINYLRDNAFQWSLTIFVSAIILLLLSIIIQSNNQSQRAYEYAEKYNCFVISRMQQDSRQFAFVCNNQVILRRF